MAFFDKKSEVISVELTSYGKYLLSKGKFKPVYYEFLDNDILYDGKYAGVIEERNDIATRIKSETPNLKPQYVFTGVETKLKQLLKVKSQLQTQRKSAVKEEELIENMQAFDKLYINSTPLGNSSFDDKYPALNFYLYNSRVKNFKLYKQNNSHIVNIPEIILENINLTSSIFVADEADIARIQNIEENQFSLQLEPTSQQLASNRRTGLKIFPDSTYISVEDKSILLQFFEQNIRNSSENFEIEFFTYETGSNGVEIIKQLYFDLSNGTTTDDPNKVEYYFNITIDGNIEDQKLKLVKNKKEPVVFQNPTKSKSIVRK